MLIKRLQLENFRIFDGERIEPSSGLNLLFGDNAAGKTSALEAIGVLSTLRSFRNAKLDELVRYQQEGFRISAIVEKEEGREIPLGIERNKGEIHIKVDGRKVNRVSELASELAVQVIHPDSHWLVSGGPKQRRRFLDWGVFHVEHAYLEQWRRFERSLRQRNAAIRANQSWKVAGSWDQIISDAAGTINQYRKNYIDELNRVMPRFTQFISETENIEIEYLPGWDIEYELLEVLEQGRDRDRRRGFTCQGPHRAELLIRVDGQPADKRISRGQQKMLVFSLLLSQIDLFRQRTGKSCILLLDDLAAELDKGHRGKLLTLLSKLAVQIFITSVQRESIRLDHWDNCKLFHVEHGQIREVI
jgi:DNA replication and repair protein RecF